MSPVPRRPTKRPQMAKLLCSFCGKDEQHVAKLIAGPDDVHICTECVELCVDVHIAEGTAIRLPAADDLSVPAQPAQPAQPPPAVGRIDATWRGAYIEGATKAERADAASGLGPGDEARCVFCAILASGRPDSETHVVRRAPSVVTILNAYPYTSGHVMVMPLRHVGELTDLADDERNELFAMLTEANAAVKRVYEPDGANVGINVGRAGGAGIPGHLHVHLVPRWNGDTNFMTSIAEVRVVPESLDRTWTKLTQAWP